jgi:phosphatidylglycerophosphate synthase
MDIGLYQLKYPFRKLIGFLLPFFKEVNPNSISWSLVPIGLVTAIVYFFAPYHPTLYLLGAFLILTRMVVGTLDGLIAVKFDKSSAEGEMINRIAPEICDILLMVALVFSMPHYFGMGIVSLGMCWAVTFFGLIGIVAGKKIQSVGPVGQTDRIVALGVFSVMQYVAKMNGWSFDFIYLFFLWMIFGSLLTITLRIKRTFKSS